MKRSPKRFFVAALISVALISGASSCKSNKKAARAKAAAEAQYVSNVNNAKQALKSIIDGETAMTTQEKEAKLKSIKQDDLHDAELSKLITKVEEMIKNERDAAGTSNMEPAVKVVDNTPRNTVTMIETTESLLNKLFDKIASGEEISKNIGKVSEMCESDNIPVLIIISKNELVTDYDRPTTIGEYLNYLKDQNVSRNKVYKIVRNGDNKISEIELIRK